MFIETKFKFLWYKVGTFHEAQNVIKYLRQACEIYSTYIVRYHVMESTRGLTYSVTRAISSVNTVICILPDCLEVAHYVD